MIEVLPRPVESAQYTSRDFTDLLATHHMRQSLSRPGQCWDNAVAESWFATLKTELIYRHTWPTMAKLRTAVFEFTEIFYNRQRIHTTLGYRTPAAYETTIHQQPAANAA
jgi:putative transposase